MTACIYYQPEGYTTSGPKLMGRNAAGESFLKGFFAHSRAREFFVQVEHPDHARHFAGAAEKSGRKEPIRVIDKNSLTALKNAGVVYCPGPGIDGHAFKRVAFGDGAWSLCGITHTTASASVMDSLVQLITAPVQPWDAVICTSMAVKDNVEKLLQAQVDYLQARLGMSKMVLPQLPVIPLGIHAGTFEFDDAKKAAARQALGVDDHTIVVLYLGRLSFHAKAHPLSMYQALETAAQKNSQSVLLVECGWHANDAIAKAYADAAQIACPSIRVKTLDGRKAQDRLTAWAGADIFCSLSDNIQETFGIVPIEAMAAGLPVVVSDWDGYRDTVRDGVDGFCIPTLMPGPGMGGDLAIRHALGIDNYDMYCGHACSLVAVDVEAAAQAFVRLFDSSELRKKMGDQGRQRAREIYDWEKIIPRYEDLWKNLNEIRKAEASKLKALVHPWPARPDPFHAFAVYPTKVLTPETRLELGTGNLETAVQKVNTFRQLSMVNFARLVLPEEAEVTAVLEAAAASQVIAIDLIKNVPEHRRAFVFRSLVWLVKLGILKVCP
jgi:alpha-maltose-1-phosphate synthase